MRIRSADLPLSRRIAAVIASELALLAAMEWLLGGGNYFHVGRFLPNAYATTSNLGTALAELFVLLVACPGLLGFVGGELKVVWVGILGAAVWPALFVAVERVQFGLVPTMLLGGSILEIAWSACVALLVGLLVTRR